MIRTALISDTIGCHSFAECLYRTLDHTTGVQPQCWVKKRQHEWELRLQDSRAFEQLVAKGIRADRKMARSDNGFAPSTQGDILHLCDFKQSSYRLKKLAKSHKPMILEVHDLHPFTALCSDLSSSCVQHKKQCYPCPRSRFPRLIRYLYEAKLSNWQHIADLTLVTHSEWLYELLARSPLAYRRRLRRISAPVSTELHKPQARAISKIRLELSTYTQLICFIAHPEYNNHEEELRLRELCHLLKHSGHSLAHLLYISPAKPPELDIPTLHISELPSKPTEFVELMSAVDLLILPPLSSIGEQITLKAMSCAIPVIASDQPLFKELVMDKITGRIVADNDIPSLFTVISEWLNAPLLRHHYGLNARRRALQQHHHTHIGLEYKKLYEEILHEAHATS